MFNLIWIIIGVLLQITITNCNCLQFYHENFTDTTNIIFQRNSTASNSVAWLLPEPDPSWATDPGNPNLTNRWYGWMVYKDGIPFLDSTNQKAKSFTTSFTFKLITARNKSPSGMAFVITTTGESRSGVSNPDFGLANDSMVSPSQYPFFAVEFDTDKGVDEVSNSHVGIDISSLNSVNVTDTSNNNSLYYPTLNLYKNSTFKAWISYDRSSQLTKVWMSKLSGNPPNLATPDYSAYANPPDESVLAPILQYKYDLSSTFSVQKSMYFGFSASTCSDSGMLGAAIFSWYFSMSDDDATSSPTKPGFTIIIISILVVIAAAIVAAAGLAIFRHRRQTIRDIAYRRGPAIFRGKRNSSTINILEFSSSANLPRYSYRALQVATNGFGDDNLVGEGGYSKVYKGTLPDGTEVAIKRLKDGGRKEAEFTAELTMINAIRHRNLLQLQGWSYSESAGEALLVYKFMRNGSLDGHLYGQRQKTVKLDGGTRLRILSGVSAALEYLHFGLGDCVLHRDVKAANVLLTEDFEPVLGDFGLARLTKHDESVTATMVGTPGYVAPEAILQGKVTDKADVYSFGVLMLEVACGRRVIVKDPLPGQQVYIVEHVSRLSKTQCIDKALDPFILQSESNVDLDVDVDEVKGKWTSILHLALMCCYQDPDSRPSMHYVHQEINSLLHPCENRTAMTPRDSNFPFEHFSTSTSPSSTSLSLKWSSSFDAAILNLHNGGR